MNRLLFPLMFLMSHLAIGQKEPVNDEVNRQPADSILVNRGDTVDLVESYAQRFNPRKALLYAAIFPGAGQAYNNKYWKIPLVYAGFVGTGYAINYNQKKYLFYKEKLFSILNEPAAPVIDPTTGTTALGNRVVGGQLVSPEGIKQDQLRNIVNRFRRDRDFSVIMTVVWYMLQMVDAHIDAHLKEFEVNPQLRVSIEPSAGQDFLTRRSAGLTLKFKF